MPMFYKYTAYYMETEEIKSCTSLKVLYNAVRSDLRFNRYANREPLTVKIYIDLPGFVFDTATPFLVMKDR